MGLRGISKRPAASVEWSSVCFQGRLNVDVAALFSKTKSKAAEIADVALSPVGNVRRLTGIVFQRKLDIVTLGDNLFGVNVEDLLHVAVNQQIALPEAEKQNTALRRKIKIPGFWRVLVEMHDRERNRLPNVLRLRRGLRHDRRCDENGKKQSGNCRAFCAKRFHCYLQFKVYDAPGSAASKQALNKRQYRYNATR